MDLGFSREEEDFRREVRDFIEQNLPDDIRDKVENRLQLEKDDYVRWQKILFARGWIAPGWPEEYGGTGWDVTRRFIFEEELDLAPTPRIIPFGLKMVGPVIYTFGSPEQKAHYLPRILNSEH